MMENSKDLSIALKIEQLKATLDKTTKFLGEFTSLEDGSKELREYV